MTSRKSFFNVKIMWETVKQYKYLMILHAVLLFLVTTIPGYIGIQDLNDRIKKGIEVTEYTVEEISAFLSGANPFVFLSAIGISVIVIACVFSYLFKSNATEFYNSMPYTRACMYVSKFAAGMLLCVLPIILILAVNSVIYLTSGLNEYFPYPQLLTGWGAAALAYLAVLALGAFAASLSGNFFAMAIVIAFSTLFYIATTFAFAMASEAWFDKFSIFFNYNANYIFPPVMLVKDAFYPSDYAVLRGAAEYVYEFIYAAAFFTAGLLCYRARKSENTKNFFAFKSVGVFLKYYVSLVGSLAFGTIFYAAGGDSVFVGYLGYILMLFIMFSAMQAIFDKNMRGMFRNIKNFAIFAAVWAAVLIIPMSGAISGYIPSDGWVKSIEMNINNIELEMKERDSIAQVMKLVRAEPDERTLAQQELMHYDALTLNLGCPLFYANGVCKTTDEEYRQLEKLVFDSKEFKDEVKNILSSEFNGAEVDKCFVELGVSMPGSPAAEYTEMEGEFESYCRYTLSSDKYRELCGILSEEIDNYDYDTARASGAYATISQGTEHDNERGHYYYRWNTITVYNCYEKTVKYLEENIGIDIFTAPGAEHHGKFYEVQSIKISENYKGGVPVFFETTNPEEIEIILKSMVYSTSGDRYLDARVDVIDESGSERTFVRSFAYDDLSDEAKAIIGERTALQR